ATSGSVSVSGFSTLDNPNEVKKLIGYLPEIPPLYVDMTVNEYLEFVCELKRADKSCIDDILTEVRILNVKNRLIKKEPLTAK
ncbi:MAG: ABC transporter, partial [Oscillospiraceae bacterium]|nr:ABC transporter [Oscillospiraceae bacterium]